MVAGARAEAERRDLDQMAFARCIAEDLPFENDTFDAVVCRFGVMFFPSPEAGVAEMLRVVRPGSWVALAVWRARELNPISAIIGDTVARYVEMPASGADAFRFAEAGTLARNLAGCGAEDVREHPLDFRHRAPVDFDGFWRIRIEMSDVLRSALAALSADEAQLVADEVRAATAEYFPSGQLDVPASALVVSARKPIGRR
jgi:SAM-dependent methyltransferase